MSRRPEQRYIRSSAPQVDNHRPQAQTLYSNVARQGIPNTGHAGHEAAIVAQKSSAVPVMNQTNMASQVANVNPTGAQLTGAAVANTGSTQMQMMPNNVMQTSGPRFGHQPFHHNQQHAPRQPQPRPTLLQNRPHTNTVPNSVQSPMGQHIAPHFYIPNPNLQAQMQHYPNNYIAHNMAQQYPQSRPMSVYGSGVYMQAFTPQQTTFSQQSYTTTPYGAMYAGGPHPYQAHPQAPAQMMQQPLHQPRGAPVANQTVIQTPQQPMVSLQTNNTEINEPTQVPSKQIVTTRQRQRAILTDPNTGKNLDIEELAKEEPKSQVPTNRSNESFTGASNHSNSMSTTTVKTTPSNDGLSIGLEFATKVAVAATEPIPKRTGSPSAPESDICLDSSLSSKPEAEEPVANSKSSSELSEVNIETSDNCDNSTDDSNLVISSSNASNNSSNVPNKTDSRHLNKSSAQNVVQSVSQVNVEDVSGEEVNVNGDIADSCNESLEEKEEEPERQEIAKEVSVQKNNINNNNHKKEMIIKEDNVSPAEEVVDTKVDTSDVTDIPKTVNESSEPQPKSDRSSPVMTRSPSVEKPLKNEVLVNSDNYDKIDNEINRINEINSNEVIEDKEPTESGVTAAPPKATLPDLPYQDDQWTPLNPGGKKHYDRDFLLAVRQKAENSLKMPESLLNDKRSQEIIRKEPSSGHYPDDPSALFMPGFASKQSSEFRRLQMPSIGRRQSQPGRHQEKQRKIISTSLTQDVKLRTTENAWKPTKMAPTTNDPDEQETLDLLKKIRGILNKLTPQKYDDLVRQIMSLKIDTEDRLKRVLDLVFDKAVDEPAFCLQYANLCKHLSHIKVTTIKEDKVEEVKFQKLLISKCQKEFETDIYADIPVKEKQEEIDNCTDPQKKKFLEEVLDEEMRRARKRSLGNIKLIGELYKLNMLKAYIMVQCIDGLLKDADDESLECLCALLRTIGEQIENEAKSQSKYTQLLDDFFRRMDEIAEQRNPAVKGTSARVRFMLRDIIDMRHNNWKARRDENLPKTLEEIHKDMQKEEEQTARDLHQHTLNKKQEERERKQKGGRQGNEGETWTTVTTRKSQNAPNPNIDWGMMRSQQQVNHETVQLGPQPGNWSMGSRGGAQSSQSKFTPKEDNRFAALDGNERKSSQKSNSSRDSSKGRSNQSHGYQSSRGGNRSQRGGEREDAINLARSFSSHRQSPSQSASESPFIYSRNSSRGGSREASAPNSRNSSMRRETPELETSRLKGSHMSEEEFQRKTENCIKEYLNVRDLKEAALDLTSLCNESNIHLFISQAINHAIETSQKIRFDIGRLFDHLLSANIIKLDHFYKGLNAVLEFEEDIIIDIPKFWEYIGEIVAPVFVNLTLNRKQFVSEVTNSCKADKRPVFVAKLFSAVSKLTDTQKANELFVGSDLRWSDYLGPNADIEEFVGCHNVEFTIRSSSKSSNLEFNQFVSEVERMVKQRRNDSNKTEAMNDEIQNYISKHFNTNQISDPRFTSALFSAVIRGCILGPSEEEQYSYTLDKNLLSVACPLLCKFLGGDADRELQALIALQELMGNLQHPSGLLYNLFQILYENSVISHEAFLQWEHSDPNAPAKATAVLSVVRFLTWLRENEESEEDNDQNETTS